MNIADSYGNHSVNSENASDFFIRSSSKDILEKQNYGIIMLPAILVLEIFVLPQ